MPSTKRALPTGRRPAPRLTGWKNVTQLSEDLAGRYTRRTIRIWIRDGKYDDERQPPKKEGGVVYVSCRAAAKRKREVTL